jgi:leucine efflux protein
MNQIALKKPPIMTFVRGQYKGFPQINYDVGMHWLLAPSNFGVIDFPAYLLGVIFTILFPGPNSLYILTITSQRGWRAGVWASLGIFMGDAILMIGVAVGAATLLNSSPMIFNLVRTLGAGYLAWMGYNLIRSGLRCRNRSESTVNALERSNYFSGLHPTLAALTLSLTNPKAIFFFISFFAQFIDPGYAHPVHPFLYLAIVLQLVSMSYLASLIFAGKFFLNFFQKEPRYAALFWIFVGLLLIGFAGRILL